MALAMLTLDEGRRQLRLYGTTEHDLDIQQKIEAATAIVLDYLKLATPLTEWPPTGSPLDEVWAGPYAVPIVDQAVREALTNLWYHRGDDTDLGPLGPRTVSLLMRLRDPALA